MPNKQFDINKFIMPVDRERIAKENPYWSVDFLAEKFNNYLSDKETPKYPMVAFMQFCKLWTTSIEAIGAVYDTELDCFVPAELHYMDYKYD